MASVTQPLLRAGAHPALAFSREVGRHLCSRLLGSDFSWPGAGDRWGVRSSFFFSNSKLALVSSLLELTRSGNLAVAFVVSYHHGFHTSTTRLPVQVDFFYSHPGEPSPLALGPCSAPGFSCFST